MKKLTRPIFSLVASTLVLLPITAFRPAGTRSPTRTKANEPVQVWLTTGDQTKLLQQQASVSFAASTTATATTITVNEGTTYQTIDGFGAAMTGSAAYLMKQKMSATQRDALLSDLFGSSGIRLSFVRHSMGASDFSAYGNYTYDDKPSGQTDPSLSSFSLGNDLTDVVPMLQAARAKNGTLKIMGTPWSAPAWMKESYTFNGGWLATANYQTYANYFVKYVQAMQAQGLPVYAVTLQNEPLYAAPYISMRMDAGNQAAFLKNNIGPAFQAAGLSTKLIVYDHNWDHPEYPNNVFADATAAGYAAGSAFHAYAGSVSAQTTTHDAYPGKDIWFTEISGSVGSSFAGDLKWHGSHIIIGTMRNWAKSALEWNLALDQGSGPVNNAVCTNCRGVVTINNSTGAVTKNVEYYALGHASKFVDPGAVRVASNSVSGGIETVAFRNPDGSKVLIALNNSSASNTFKVSWNAQSFNYTLPAGALATFKWNTSDVPLGRVFEISSKSNGKALEITAASTANNALLQQHTWAAAVHQKWRMVDAGNGFVRIVNQNSNKSLQIVSGGTANGSKAEQLDWNSNATQAWLVQQQSDGTYRIINKNSNKALDTPSAAEDADIQQWDWTGADNQRWWLSDQGAARAALATADAAAEARLQVYPTEIDRELTFDYTAEAAGPLQVQLVDALGRVALLPPAIAAKAGLNHVTLDVRAARVGMYVLQVRGPEGTLSRRVLVAR
jgi:glucosylceramidase